ncbi:MAG: glycosyltransferase [Proteobacteria bacterium]|nr:MAG: glycosyltransferase [Pseudomonadota bacterium]
MKILFYNDSPIFGGHEIMTVNVVRSLLSMDYELTFAYSLFNQKFHDILNELLISYPNNLTLMPVKFKSSHIQSIMSFFQFLDLILLYKKVINKFDLILASQGDIEISSKIIIAGKLARIKVISYIPSDFLPSDLGVPFSWLRDKFAKVLYRMVDGFISISPSFINGLQHKLNLPKNKIFLLENIINCNKIPKYKLFDRFHKPFRFIMVGAVNSRKNQIFLLNWLEMHPNFICELLIVGTGPLSPQLQSRVNSSSILNSKVRFLGWSDNPLEIMSECDLLLIPSVVEGVPLVMLEAAAIKLPILATDANGMADFLPHEMKFKLNDYENFSRKLEFLLSQHNEVNSLIEANYQKVIKYNDLNYFNQQVKLIFSKLLNGAND